MVYYPYILVSLWSHCCHARGNPSNGTTLPERRSFSVHFLPLYAFTDDVKGIMSYFCLGLIPLLPQKEKILPMTCYGSKYMSLTSLGFLNMRNDRYFPKKVLTSIKLLLKAPTETNNQNSDLLWLSGFCFRSTQNTYASRDTSLTACPKSCLGKHFCRKANAEAPTYEGLALIPLLPRVHQRR